MVIRSCLFTTLLLLLCFVSKGQDGNSENHYRPEPAIVRGFMIREVNTEKDFTDLKSWGANVVRMQMHPGRYAARRNQSVREAMPGYLDQLENQVVMAGNAGLKVVADLQSPPFTDVKSPDRPEFWNRPDLEPEFCRFWTEVAARLYKHREFIWGYDLLNEPLDRSQLPGVTKQWRPLAIKIIEAIRKVDPETWIVFEPGPGSLFSGFRNLEPLTDKRIIYSAHFYNPQEFTHQGVITTQGTDLPKPMEKINLYYPGEVNDVYWDKKKLEETLRYADEFQAKWKVPIYVGEFSVIRWAPEESSLQWIKDVTGMFEDRGWSWSYHAFREFHGWSLEHDGQYWHPSMPVPSRVDHETPRGKFIKSLMSKNLQ